MNEPIGKAQAAQVSGAGEGDRPWTGFLLRAGLLLGIAVLWVFWELRAPGSGVLFPEHGAQWIQKFRETELRSFDYRERRVLFRKVLRLERPVHAGVLRYRAMNAAALLLDGRLLQGADRSAQPAGHLQEVPLPPLPAGEHRVELLVIADNRHPAVLAHAEHLGLATGLDWEASLNGEQWSPVKHAGELRRPALAEAFPPPLRALSELLPVLGALFLLGIAGLAAGRRRGWRMPPASRLRWVLLLAWAALALNNLLKLPAGLGMDSEGHIAYIARLGGAWQLPLATEGGQMFQPPLFYFLSVPGWLLFKSLGGRFELLLSVLPLLCGLALIEISYRTLATVFPGRDDLQIAGTAAAGFLPINLYMSQFPGNEPLSGVLCGLVILLWFKANFEDGGDLAWRPAVRLGLVLGLAFLTKVTAILVLVGLALDLLVHRPGDPGLRGASARTRSARWLAASAAVACAVCGWYYLRNWARLGQPFVGGWDPARGDAWWQDPGFIPINALTSFGRAWAAPIYAQVAGYWDGLYATFAMDASLSGTVVLAGRPPWNLRPMLACAVLVLIPLALMVLGALRGFRSWAVRCCLLLIALHLLAVFHLYVGSVQAYSTLKASYLMGLLPCFGVLVAAGLQALPDRFLMRPLASLLLGMWVLAAYTSYFIR